eukprot:scaffold6105_cov23-Cyclotella_meneghiniana.AAC.1
MECLHVGTPPSDYEVWETKIIHFHNFLDLSDTKGEDNFVYSPKFKCFGHTWRLRVFPGGDNASDDGYVSAYLYNRSDEKITADWKLILLNADGNEEIMEEEEIGDSNEVFKEVNEVGCCWGGDLIERAKLVENESLTKYLDNGALKIKVQLRLSKGSYHSRIRQQLPDSDNMDIFQDDETSDVAFDLKGDVIVAHKGIIKSKASDFYVMCEGYSKTSPMTITDVDKDIFQIMLASLYGGEVYPEEWKKHSESILKAASKYGFSTLKSEAELWYSMSLKFTVDNVISKFMEADGNGYALVKAAAKKFIMEHGEEVVGSESFDLLHESKELSREVMAASFQNSKKRKREDGQES